MLWTLSWPLLGILMTESLPLLTQYIQAWDQQLFWELVIRTGWGVIVYFVYNHVMRNQGLFGARYQGQTEMWWDFFERFVKAHPTIVEWIGTWKILSKAQKGIETHINLLSHIIWQLPQFVITCVYVLYKIADYGIVISLVFFISLWWVFLAIAWIQSYSLVYRKKRNAAHDNATKHIVRMIMTKTAMMMHGTHTYEQKKLKGLFEDMRKRDLKKHLYEHRWFNLPFFFLSAWKILTFAFIGYLIFQWSQRIEDLIIILALWTMLDRVIDNGVSIYKMRVKQHIKLDSYRDLRDTLVPLPWRDVWSDVQAGQKTLLFEDVSFGYKKDKKIITDLSLRIAPGETVALVWPSGGGKSTIMKLIAWHVLAQSGAIKRWEQELPNHKADNSHIKLSERYKHVWYVTQEPLVFDGTVRENLLYGVGGGRANLLDVPNDVNNHNTKGNGDDINGNAKSVSLHDAIQNAQCQFIYDLPDGLDTIIGERGVRLSWGQRQRLVIAQLLLQRPGVILLDEPTSALDSESEDAITQVIHELFADATMVIVAHRLQTVRQADRILYIENGQIVEEWDHGSLIARGAKYSTLVQLQSSF